MRAEKYIKYRIIFQNPEKHDIIIMNMSSAKNDIHFADPLLTMSGRNSSPQVKYFASSSFLIT